MDAVEFIDTVKRNPAQACKYLSKYIENPKTAPEWLRVFTEDRSVFLAHEAECHILGAPREQAPEFLCGEDPSFQVPVEAVFTARLSEHRNNGYTRVLYGNSTVTTVNFGPEVEHLRALEKEYRMTDQPESQLVPIQLYTVIRDNVLYVYYLGMPGYSDGEPDWTVLFKEPCDVKTVCDWGLRGAEYAQEIVKRDRSDFEVLFERAKSYILMEAARTLGIHPGKKCEVLPVPADVVGPKFGFALCKELLLPEMVVLKVKPVLQSRYTPDIIQTLLADVGVDLVKVSELEGSGTPVTVPVKHWEPAGESLPKQCPDCGNFLIRIPAMTIIGETVSARCPRCWHQEKVPLTDGIRHAFASRLVQQEHTP